MREKIFSKLGENFSDLAHVYIIGGIFLKENTILIVLFPQKIKGQELLLFEH